MKRTTGSAIAIAALVGLAGCSSDDIAESIAERAVESESGGDVDIDMDDGDFSVQTEDGSFEMTTDEDGNVVIRAQDAEGNDIFSADSDSDDGVTRIETEDGDATITRSGDGDDAEMVVETEDGTATYTQSGDLPDDFPDIPLPDDLSVLMSQQSDAGEGVTNVVVGSAPGDWESYLDELTAFLEDNGYTQQSLTTTPEGAFFQYVDAGGTMVIAGGLGADPASGGMSINLTIGPN